MGSDDRAILHDGIRVKNRSWQNNEVIPYFSTRRTLHAFMKKRDPEPSSTAVNANPVPDFVRASQRASVPSGPVASIEKQPPAKENTPSFSGGGGRSTPDSHAVTRSADTTGASRIHEDRMPRGYSQVTRRRHTTNTAA